MTYYYGADIVRCKCRNISK